MWKRLKKGGRIFLGKNFVAFFRNVGLVVIKICQLELIHQSVDLTNSLSFPPHPEYYCCIPRRNNSYGEPEFEYEFIEPREFEFKRNIILGDEAPQLGQYRYKEQKGVSFSDKSVLCYEEGKTRTVKLGNEGKKRYKKASFVIFWSSGE